MPPRVLLGALSSINTLINFSLPLCTTCRWTVLSAGAFFNLATSAGFTVNTHCEWFVHCSWFPVAAANVCVSICICTETAVFSQWLEPDRLCRLWGSSKPHDSCSRQQFSTSFMHHMDTELMLYTEYHMTKGTLVIVCVRACVCAGVRVFPTVLAAGRLTYE